MQMKRIDLETKVKALSRKLIHLKKQKKLLAKKKLSNTVLMRIKAEKNYQKISSQQPQFQDLLKKYVEIKKEVANANATCAVLEAKIEEEKEKRHIILEEYEDIDDVFNFMDYWPHFNFQRYKSFQNYPNEDSFVYRRRMEYLRGIYKQINDIDCQRLKSETRPQAALEFSRAAFAEVKLKTIGNSCLNLEIESMNQALRDLSFEINKRENEKENIRQKIIHFELECKKELAKYQQRAEVFNEANAKEMNSIQQEIYNLQLGINKTAREFDFIENEIEKINKEIKVYDFAHDSMNNNTMQYNDDDDDDDDNDNEVYNDKIQYDDFDDENITQNEDLPNFDFSDGKNKYYNPINPVEKIYLQQKVELQSEVNQLQKQLDNIKIKAKEKSSKLKAEVYELYEILTDKKRIIKSEMNLLDDDLSSSGLSSAFSTIASHIDMSIQDLKYADSSV
ncbi:hypothetical protein TRFO_40989 [Tritrichomonas foetus]|uniref:Uncharacterized protein n=1 Tax=Tritrichomonas foetus TaxID=1144522 RepID=A0A1J4J5E7_9EUKA|nr:hypothetical protein TRFO_40989 [Tritrichomonas foetus]|eukprot:OHS92693.1 hypothetical protein TRFO_40989 [Tritrichomonas foetus]